MLHNFKAKDIFEFSHQVNVKNNKQVVVFPEDIGNCSMEKTKINEDVFLYKHDYKANKDFSIDSNNTQSVFGLQIVLNDDSYHKDKITNTDIYTRQGYTNTSFINESKSMTIHKANSNLQSIAIIVKDDFLQNNLFNQMKNTNDIYSKPSTIFKNRPTNLKTQICATELFNSPFTGSLDKIYRESKVLEILYHEFSDILDMNNNPISSNKIIFDDFDIEALAQAKDILLNNIKNPPSMDELSKLVRLNQFKLKTGFKQKYNMAPYKLLAQHRMHTAKQLLESGGMNVAEISEFVGYKYQNSFAKAFREYFGVRPKDLIKSRKYYY